MRGNTVPGAASSSANDASKTVPMTPAAQVASTGSQRSAPTMASEPLGPLTIPGAMAIVLVSRERSRRPARLSDDAASRARSFRPEPSTA